MNRRYCIVNSANLKKYNTMHLDAYADSLIVPFCESGAIEALKDFDDDEIVVIGNGSNIIFSKPRYEKPVLTTILLNNIEYKNNEIVAESGVSLSRLAWFALEHNIEGFEYLEDIPGSVGGALFMNAGTNDGNIGSQVVSVTVFDYGSKEKITLAEDKLSSFWGYRDSFFRHHRCFIFSCKMRADKQNEGDYQAILEKVTSIKRNRYLKQPRNYPSAGSVFKRPYIDGKPMYIWKLFDEAGLRGFRIGDAQVSDKHPGFIVNLGSATGEDVLKLLNHCKRTVMDKFGVAIEEEWKII